MIRTLICDLGNVLCFFSHEKMYAQVGRLYGVSGSAMKAAFTEKGWLREYETGRLSSGQLRRLLHETFKPDVESDDETLLQASSDIFEVNPSMLELVDRLKQLGLRLVLLSNTSDAHRLWVERNFDVLQRFDAMVLSYEVGFVKPEAGIYVAAQQQALCLPSECFYIDDIPEYIAMGRKQGWHAEVYRSTDEIATRLRSLGVELNDE